MTEVQKGGQQYREGVFVIEDFELASLTQAFFLEQGTRLHIDGTNGYPWIVPEQLALRAGAFTAYIPSGSFPLVQLFPQP